MRWFLFALPDAVLLTDAEIQNQKCDTLAKAAVYFGTQRQQRPHKPASIFHKEKKLSGDCGDEIQFQVYFRLSRKIFIEELGWHGLTFDDVDWEHRAACLRSKPEMYQLWLSKQSTGFCATGVNMGHWFDATVTSCPNCFRPAEAVGHLLHCKDAGRIKLASTKAPIDLVPICTILIPGTGHSKIVAPVAKDNTLCDCVTTLKIPSTFTF
jgi:hypothetical protein